MATGDRSSRLGPTNSLVDVDGLQVGHAQRIGDGWLTGTTVVLAPGDGAVAGVDVRGGGPGTRETDLLDPRNLVERVHAVVLSGGSAYGLAAADGVMSRLESVGRGFPVATGVVVPIVPAAVIFDLGRGGDPAARPDATFGAAAFDAALGSDAGQRVTEGCVGAGTGAVAGDLKGGVGSASAVLPDGGTVAALAVVNAIGSAVDPQSGELFGGRWLHPSDAGPLRAPGAAEVAQWHRAAPAARPGLATTLGVVATDLTLTKGQCQKLAGIGHDGLARAVDPAHTLIDGDTVFALATCARPAPDLLGLQQLIAVAGRCFVRAVVRGLLAATSVDSAAGPIRCYRDVFPSAFLSDSPGTGSPSR